MSIYSENFTTYIFDNRNTYVASWVTQNAYSRIGQQSSRISQRIHLKLELKVNREPKERCQWSPPVSPGGNSGQASCIDDSHESCFIKLEPSRMKSFNKAQDGY